MFTAGWGKRWRTQRTWTRNCAPPNLSAKKFFKPDGNNSNYFFHCRPHEHKGLASLSMDNFTSLKIWFLPKKLEFTQSFKFTQCSACLPSSNYIRHPPIKRQAQHTAKQGSTSILRGCPPRSSLPILSKIESICVRLASSGRYTATYIAPGR